MIISESIHTTKDIFITLILDLHIFLDIYYNNKGSYTGIKHEL